MHFGAIDPANIKRVIPLHIAYSLQLSHDIRPGLVIFPGANFTRCCTMVRQPGCFFILKDSLFVH